MTPIDGLGWLATAMFLASYSCRTQRALRLTQAAAALLWVAYGVLLHALPVIVANVLVAAVAAYSSFSRKLAIKSSAGPDLSRIS
jgi:Bacterial inner membrane protein